MAQLLTESIVDKLLAYYQENLPAKLHALNAQHGDALLKAPMTGAYHVGALALRSNIDYPKVFVIGESMGVRRYDRTWTDADHAVTIRAAVKSTNTDDLQRMMYRWGVALWELLVDRFFATTGDDFPALHGEGEITIEYERPEAQDTSGAYIGSTTLTATFNKQEYS